MNYEDIISASAGGAGFSENHKSSNGESDNAHIINPVSLRQLNSNI